MSDLIIPIHASYTDTSCYKAYKSVDVNEDPLDEFTDYFLDENCNEIAEFEDNCIVLHIL